MTSSLTYHADRAYIEITLAGIVSLEELERLRTELVSAVARHACLTILVDLTGKEQPVSIFDLYRLNAGGTGMLPDLLRMALVHQPEHERETQYYADLKQRSGLNVRRFTDRQAALAWLLDEQRLSPPPAG